VAIFRFFQMAAADIVDFQNFTFLTSRTVNRVEQRHRVKLCRNHSYCDLDMAIFRFSNFQIFNGRNGEEGRTALSSQISSKSLEPRPRCGHFSIFPRWRPSAMLDLWWVCWDHPRRAFSRLYHCAKCGWNWCSSFHNMHVFRFRELGLKTPIHAQQ